MRSQNEDAFLASPPVYLVADGVGGHAAGDVASRLVAQEFAALAGTSTVQPEDVYDCFARAARRLRESFAPGVLAGSTVAGVVAIEEAQGTYWLVFNIGDSRVYRWFDGELTQITVDHSLAQRRVDRGEAERIEPTERHVLTKAVDTVSTPAPDYWLTPVEEGDRLLICSDGLTQEVSDSAIGVALAESADPQQAADRLVADALAAGGRDNVTVVVVDALGVDEPADAGWTMPRTDIRAYGELTMSDEEWDEMVNGSTVPFSANPTAEGT